MLAIAYHYANAVTLLHIVELRGGQQRGDDCSAHRAVVGPGEPVVLATKGDGRMVAMLVSSSIRPSSRNRQKTLQQVSAYRIASARPPRGRMRLNAVSMIFNNPDSGSDWTRRTPCRVSAVWPRRVAPIAYARRCASALRPRSCAPMAAAQPRTWSAGFRTP
jgi:hypothetical protein